MNKLWQDRCMAVAKLVATWSHDPSTKVGAVLSRNNKRTLSTGHNHFPAGHSNDPALWADREYKYKHVIHAEIAALKQALSYNKRLVEGSTMVVNFPVCPDCMLALALHGVSTVVQPRLEDTEGYAERGQKWINQWRKWMAEAAQVAADHCVVVVEHGQ